MRAVLPPSLSHIIGLSPIGHARCALCLSHWGTRAMLPPLSRMHPHEQEEARGIAARGQAQRYAGASGRACPSRRPSASMAYPK